MWHILFCQEELLTGHKFAGVLRMQLCYIFMLRSLSPSLSLSASCLSLFSFLCLPPALAALLLALSNIFSKLPFFLAAATKKNGYLLCL